MSTSSIIAAVLVNADRLEKEDIRAKLRVLSKETNKLKAKVYDSLEKKYEDFYSTQINTVDFAAKVQSLSGEMQEVTTKVEKEIQSKPNISSAELEDLLSQLSESRSILCVLERFVSIEQSFQDFDVSIESLNYHKALSNLATVHDVLKASTDPREGEIRILQAQHAKYCNLSSKLLTTVNMAWQEKVKWQLSKTDHQVKTTLCIRQDVCQDDVFVGLIQTMKDMKILSEELRSFGDRLLKSVINPIVSFSDLKIMFDESSEHSMLSLTGQTQDSVISPQSVFEQLTMVMNFLYEHLFYVEIKTDGSGPAGDGSDQQSLMCLLGSFIKKEMFNLIINNSLGLSVPSICSELEEYTEIIHKTKAFQNMLHSTHFLQPDDAVLSDYIHDVNMLFANKKCQEILQKARSLMTCDVHNMVKITPSRSKDALQLEKTPTKLSQSESRRSSADNTLSTETFYFPTCCISTSVKELMDLTYDILHEATSVDSTDLCRGLLCSSVSHIFVLFADVVPTYHKHSLENVPQITALYHNNCMYIAHHLLILGHRFRPDLPMPLSLGLATFIDLVPKLRHLGTESFLHQITKQKDVILECLAGATGFVCVSEEDGYRVSEHSIRQVLHQVQRLSNVWCPVLPAKTYYKSIGFLLNTTIVEIMSKVMSLQNVSVDEASQLQYLMLLVTENAEKLFQVKTNDTGPQNTQTLLQGNIRRWNKFSDLMWLLSTDLEHIVDRWSDRKGSLATEFQANEIRLVIKAVFKDTDKRSEILSTIK